MVFVDYEKKFAEQMVDLNADDTILMLSYEPHFLHPYGFVYKVAKDSIRSNLFTFIMSSFLEFRKMYIFWNITSTFKQHISFNLE